MSNEFKFCPQCAAPLAWISQAEDGGEYHQDGQRLDQRPGPAQDAGAVAGGEIPVGEGPDQGPLPVEVGQHGALPLPVITRPSHNGGESTQGAYGPSNAAGTTAMPSLRRYAADPLQVANIVIVNWAGAFDFSAQRVRSGLSRTSTLHPVAEAADLRRDYRFRH